MIGRATRIISEKPIASSWAKLATSIVPMIATTHDGEDAHEHPEGLDDPHEIGPDDLIMIGYAGTHRRHFLL